MEDDKLFKINNENNDISNNDVEKFIKEKLYLSINEKENHRINTENDEIMSNREKENDNKLNELIENHKILNTLRSFKTTTSLNIEEVKNMPSLFVELMDALKKSNSNVSELKETIDELIKKEKKISLRGKELEKENESLRLKIEKKREGELEMKKKIEAIKIEYHSLSQNFAMANDFQRKYEELLKESRILHRQEEESIRTIEYLKDQNEKNLNIIDELQQTITQYKKAVNDLSNKNQRYKSNQNQLQGELEDIQDKLSEIKNFKQEIKEFQDETQKLRSKLKDLESDRRSQQEKEQKLKDEIKTLSANNKKIKSELKNELNEKINLLKEIEAIKGTQKSATEKQDILKLTMENLSQENEKLNSTLKKNLQEKEDLEIKLKNSQEQLADLGAKFQDLFEDYNKLLKENQEIHAQLSEKKFCDSEVFKLTDKYEEEIFTLKCEMNIWKNAFIEIAKYKLLNYDDSNSDELVGLDKNYLQNSPVYLREKADSVLTYFRSLVEEESYQTSNLKALKEALLQEQDKNASLREVLNNELHLRRKIQNRYMLIRGNLRVMCRIRPFLEQSENTSLIKKAFLDTFDISNESVVLKESINSNRHKKYDFDYIFGQRAQQPEVYEEVSLLIQSMLRGNNICIIGYGQTCTGKTYTIQGPQGGSQPGIALRAAKELFDILSLSDKEKPNNAQSKLSLSIIEIYNESVFNLLGDDCPQLSIYENSNGNLVIPDLNPINIESYGEAAKLFKLSAKLRKTKETNNNDRSSRSHCIYTFHLKTVEGEKTVRSKLHIIDLAGSERLSKNVGVVEENLRKEAISINLSLSSLSNVLNSIASKSNHVPYRDSKLTHFLKESLNENYNILLLLHVSPNIKDLAETFSTLEFGNRIVKICKHKTGKEKNK